jgi:hypothetical protein
MNALSYKFGRLRVRCCQTQQPLTALTKNCPQNQPILTAFTKLPKPKPPLTAFNSKQPTGPTTSHYTHKRTALNVTASHCTPTKQLKYQTPFTALTITTPKLTASQWTHTTLTQNPTAYHWTHPTLTQHKPPLTANTQPCPNTSASHWSNTTLPLTPKPPTALTIIPQTLAPLTAFTENSFNPQASLSTLTQHCPNPNRL